MRAVHYESGVKVKGGVSGIDICVRCAAYAEDFELSFVQAHVA